MKYKQVIIREPSTLDYAIGKALLPIRGKVYKIEAKWQLNLYTSLSDALIEVWYVENENGG